MGAQGAEQPKTVVSGPAAQETLKKDVKELSSWASYRTEVSIGFGRIVEIEAPILLVNMV